ncbi:U3 small nucleolar ribonucleoprotein protein IMP4-like isoform X2 [Hibiscus syriacus]|uniref:U3 small nucleolar ribonucleoprotein protein IMP4-like isoform X2 n=1 Tax=Hibiscus syriacus TaxID=106335 RepID=UPI0019223846|nr:U3 small nucleolar ribonucleoprotein protein IMP4-like isoform X2 [Hibiscus syriacus]
MLRRNIRLRREYLYRKSLEGKERLFYEKKRKIKEALDEGKPIPTELRNEEAALRQEIDLEDDYTAGNSHIDDEYANATVRDPKILLTTSRDPSAPLVQFVKELKFVFPNAERMNRGSQVISEIIESCRAHEFTDVILVHEHRGVPDGLIISHLPFGPTAYFGLLNVVTRHDIKDKKAMGTMPEAYPHLILDNFKTKLGERTANILKHLFPVPKPDTKRIVTFANRSDYISFRHHIYEKPGGPKSVELKEIGPRFELRLYQVKLGTMEQSEAQVEWVIRPYMNTTKKQNIIGNDQESDDKRRKMKA